MKIQTGKSLEVTK